MYLDRRQEDEERIPYTHLRSSAPTAKKDHVCTSCRSAITIGTKYGVNVTLVDGAFHYERLCPTCRFHEDY